MFHLLHFKISLEIWQWEILDDCQLSYFGSDLPRDFFFSETHKNFQHFMNVFNHQEDIVIVHILYKFSNSGIEKLSNLDLIPSIVSLHLVV